MFFIALCLFAQDSKPGTEEAVNVAGDWQLSWNGMMGRMDGVLQIRQDGSKLTGTAQGIAMTGTIHGSDESRFHRHCRGQQYDRQNIRRASMDSNSPLKNFEKRGKVYEFQTPNDRFLCGHCTAVRSIRAAEVNPRRSDRFPDRFEIERTGNPAGQRGACIR